MLIMFFLLVIFIYLIKKSLLYFFLINIFGFVLGFGDLVMSKINLCFYELYFSRGDR